jgi:uncharacterized protein (TIGR00255 family)
MTGFCSLNKQVQLTSSGNLGLTVELKTLNGRFCEVVSKLPSCLSPLELVISTHLQEKLIRGRVYLTVRINDQNAKLHTITPAWEVINQYLQAAQDIKQRYNLSGDVPLVELLKMPNVLASDENVMAEDDERTLIGVIEEAATKVMTMRIEEGKRLQKDFEKIFEVCGQKMTSVSAAFDVEVARQKDLLKTAMETLPTPEEQEKAAEDIQNALRKMDIHEEITRFKSHLESVKNFLQTSASEKGKRLEFMLQELLRETNTTMAKCPTYGISAACIDIKVELEKAREQIQNIV